MSGTPRPHRLLTIALTIVGLVTIITAAIAFLQGWDTDAAAPWRTVATIGGVVCGALGVGFALLEGRRR